MQYRFLTLVFCILLLSSCTKSSVEKKQPSASKESISEVQEEKKEKHVPFPTFNCSLEKYSLELFGAESPCYFTVSRVGEEASTYKLDSRWNQDSTIELAKLVGSDEVFAILQEHRDDNHFVCKFFKCDDQLKEVFTLDNGYSPLHFVSDGDSDKKFVQAYDWWYKDSGARAIAPQVVLMWRDNQLKFDKEKMREMKPDEDDINQSQKSFRAEARDKKSTWPSIEFEDYLIGLIYSGNEKQAKRMLNYCWPKTRSGKQKFWNDLRRKLKKSPYYLQVKEINRA